MNDSGKYDVLLFHSVSYALKAEKILKKENLPYKLIPVPKHISSDCGVCMMIDVRTKEKILSVLEGVVDIESIRPLES